MEKMVLYFSPTGTTRKRAEALAEAEGARLIELRPAKPYTAADLDWTDSRSRSTREMKDPQARPALQEVPDLAGCRELFLGFPIWWGLAPRIVDTLLDSLDLNGVTVVPFATSGGSGIERAERDLQKNHPGIRFAQGRLLNGNIPEDQLKYWADRVG